jgi:hypothetical protein
LCICLAACFVTVSSSLSDWLRIAHTHYCSNRWNWCYQPALCANKAQMDTSDFISMRRYDDHFCLRSVIQALVALALSCAALNTAKVS